jgi:hypothetical protein
MTRAEWTEWIVMIAIILLWWPVLFWGWMPDYYRYGLTVVSAGALITIFVRRLRRMNQGFSESERMMAAKRAMEDQLRGGKPTLDEKRPPDVSDKLPFGPRADGQAPDDEE